MSAKGIFVDPTKIKAINELKALKSVTEIRSFLCLARYYRRFIEGFSRLTVSLSTLTRNGKKYEWIEKHEMNGLKNTKRALKKITKISLNNRIDSHNPTKWRGISYL